MLQTANITIKSTLLLKEVTRGLELWIVALSLRLKSLATTVSSAWIGCDTQAGSWGYWDGEKKRGSLHLMKGFSVLFMGLIHGWGGEL